MESPRPRRGIVVGRSTTGRAGPLFRDFAEEFMRRQSRRWKPATGESNRSALDNRVLPFFAAMRLAAIDRADVARWFDSHKTVSGIPGAVHLMSREG